MDDIKGITLGSTKWKACRCDLIKTINKKILNSLAFHSKNNTFFTGDEGNRTFNFMLAKQTLYHWVTPLITQLQKDCMKKLMIPRED